MLRNEPHTIAIRFNRLVEVKRNHDILLFKVYLIIISTWKRDYRQYIIIKINIVCSEAEIIFSISICIRNFCYQLLLAIKVFVLRIILLCSRAFG